MKNRFFKTFVLFVLANCFVLTARGFDNASKASQQVIIPYSSQVAENFLGGHDTITAEGMLLKKRIHDGNEDFMDWADKKALPPLRIGAHDEDTNDLLNFILRDPPLGPNGWGDFYRHFYDSRLGDDTENAIGPQATKAVKDYLEKIRELTHCTSKSFESLSPGDKTRVYDYLGRITHLYQDMFCPSHVKVESHPFHHPFEQYINDKWGEVTRSSSFQDRVTIGAYLKGNYDIGVSINPIQAMKVAAQKNIGFWGEEALCDLWDEQGVSCLQVNDERLQQNIDTLIPEAILSTAGYIDSIYRAAKAPPDYGNICLPKPLQGPGGDHPDDRFDVSDAFYWQDRFQLSETRLTDLFMRTGLKKGKTALWYRKRLKELHESGKHAPLNMPVSEKTRIYNEFKSISQKLGEMSPGMDWITSPDIALFAYGFYNPAISLMLKIKESVRFLDLEFDPSIVHDHPVMLVPTAGFAGFEQSATLKAKLEEYVRLGGTLVVFAQQLGHHWNMLPVPIDPATGEAKPILGYGYQQDQNCQQGSVFIETNHDILSSFASATIDVGVDGYFGSYPDDSTILLRRTANGQPAMILYPYGNGYVFATTLYTDFAFSHSQANKPEVDLVANIISWAKKPVELPKIRPGETISLNIPITNSMYSNASSAKLRIYSSARSALLAEQVIAGNVPASESTVIATQFTVPGNGSLGIYHIDYVLLDAHGDIVQPQTETDAGRFVVSNPPKAGVPDKPIWFAVTTTSQEVLLNDPMNYTFHVYNTSDETRSLEIQNYFRHTGRSHTWNVTVPPKSEATVSSFDLFTDDRWMYETMEAYLLNELKGQIGYYQLSFKGAHAAGEISVSTDKQVYANNQAMRLRTVVRNKTAARGALIGASFVIKTKITGVFENSRSVSLAAGGTSNYDVDVLLPSTVKSGPYIVCVEMWNGDSRISTYNTGFEVLQSQVSVTPNLSSPFVAGTNSVSFTLMNTGRISVDSGVLDISLQDPDGFTIFSRSHPFVLSVGENRSISVPIGIPNPVFGDYTLAYTQSDGTKTGNPTTIIIRNAVSIVLATDKTSYQARETARLLMTVMNTGKFNLDSLLVTVDIPNLAYSEMGVIGVLQGQSTVLQRLVPIPEAVTVGSHEITVGVTLPSGSSTAQYFSLFIPEPSLVIDYEGPRSLNLGDVISLNIENRGGVDASYEASKITMTDGLGVVLYQGSASGSIMVNQKKKLIDIRIPDQAKHSHVYLAARVTSDNTSKQFSLDAVLAVTGIAAKVRAKTGKDVYLNTDEAAALSEIANGFFPIIDGNLEVAVNSARHGQFKHFLPKRGWASFIRNPHGVAVSSDGFVYVTDFCDSRVYKLGQEGILLQWGSHGTGDGQFDGPMGIAVGTDGSVYISDYYNARIQKFDADGQFITKWGGHGAGDSEFAGPDGIAVGPDNTIYVVDSDNYRVQKFDSYGNFILKWGRQGNKIGEFHDPRGIAVSLDDFVYVSNSLSGTGVQKFDANGGFVTEWRNGNPDQGQIQGPILAIAVGPDGAVYVTETNRHRVLKFDSNGYFAMEWGSQGILDGQFEFPYGIAVDGRGSIYVVESGNKRIQKFDSNSNFTSKWGSFGINDGEFYEPAGLAMSREGYLVVADSENSRIQVFDSAKTFVTKWGTKGMGDGQFQNPQAVAVGPDGHVYVADTGNHRVQKFTIYGDLITQWGSQGFEPGQFFFPRCIALGNDGFVYVGDATNRIQKFDSTGNFVTGWQGASSVGGISVSSGGLIYVTDDYSERILKFNSTGALVASWGGKGQGDGQFDWVHGVAVDSNGYVYVTDILNRRVQKFDGNGKFVDKWGHYGNGDGQFYIPFGIAVSAEGFVYVSDREEHRIQSIDPSKSGTLFQTISPINQTAGSNQQYLANMGNLNATGKFYLEAILTNRLGQRLAQSTYPFYIAEAKMVILFSTDKKIYRPGEMVTIQGEVRNLSSVSIQGASLLFTQRSALGAETLFKIVFDLPASGSHPFTVVAGTAGDGTYTLTGKVIQGDTTISETADQYEVITPTVLLSIVSPDIAGIEPFAVTLEIANNSKIDATVTLTSSFGSEVLTIPAAAFLILTYPGQQISQDTTYTFSLSGDLNETISKTVLYGLSINLWIDVVTMYREEEKVVIPIYVYNAGSLEQNITIDIMLQPSGIALQKTYFIPRRGGVSDTLFFDLTEGDYTVTLTSQTPPASTSASFFVRKGTKVNMAAITINAATGGLISVSTRVLNEGAAALEGTIQMSIIDIQGAVVWQVNHAVSIPLSATPLPVPIDFSFSPATLPPGTYTLAVTLLSEAWQELASQSMPLAITGANIRISQMPSPQTVNVGEEAAFVFKVANTGGRDGLAEFTVKSSDFINLTRRELLGPGEEKNFQFAFPIPADLEEKDYYAEYELKGTNGTLAKGQVKYHVAGINISVVASLDKEHYREGETAHLAMIISQQPGGGPHNFFARVNYGDFEGKQSFTLTASQNLSFAIPLTAITGEKLFFGVYDEGGRSIHLNSLHMNKTGDTFTITTNKQVYNQGETVTMVITGTGTGTMTTSGPGGYGETFLFNGSSARSFALPRIATAGTYYIEASLATGEGQTVSMSKPIDIAGVSVKVKEAVLDKGKYLPGDALRVSMRIESNSDMPATLKVWSIDPDKNSIFLGERQLSLTRTEQVLFSADYPLTISSSGIHKVLYGIYSDHLLLSSGNLSFDAGEGVMLGMTIDRSDYPLGSETVAVKLNIFGTTDAMLTLNVNGTAIHSEPVSLNGFATATIPIPMPGPGAHTLEGILAAGGLSSKKEIKFLYGTNLPDLTADVWGSGTAINKDGTLKLMASVGNRGKTTASSATLTLYDGEIPLAAFATNGIEAGATRSYEYLWSILGKAGEHTLQATVDPQSSLIEFTKDNNRVTRRIVIPDIALITETDKESYSTGEQVAINATTINLTAGTNYPNLTCTTIIRDPSGNEIFRKDITLGLSPSQSGLTTTIWNTAGLASEGKYSIRQEIASGTTLLAEKTKIITIAASTGFALRVNPASVKIKQGETGHFTISADAPAGWGGSVTLDAEGIPVGTIASFAPNVVTGSGISAVSITTSSATPPGTYPVIFRGQGGDVSGIVAQSIPVVLDVSGFSLQAEPQSISITQQETADFTVRVTSMNGYSGNIIISDTTGRIGGLIVTVDNPNLAVPGETVVRIQSSKYVPPGTYTIKISGNDGIIDKDVNLLVGVNQNLDSVPGFVLTPGPGFDNRALVSILDRNFVEKIEFTAFKTRFGANAVMGDIDGDGEDEIIVAPGPDPFADGRVRVFRQNGALLLDQPILASKFGATLASGDIDGDWREEIVVGAGPGLKNTARVKVLSFNGQRFENTGIDFIAFPNAYKLGVKVALGDVDGDGTLEIIAGAGPSLLNPPRIKVFKVETSGGIGNWGISSTVTDFIADFGDWYSYLFGVNVAAGDIDGDGMAEIIAGAGPNPLQKAVVAIYKGDGTFTGTRFEAYPARDYRLGVTVTARDLDGDGLADIITAPGPSPFNDSWVRVFRGDGTLLSDGFLAFPRSIKFGAKVSIGNVGE